MYSGLTGISHWWNITHDSECTGTDITYVKECTGDRQGYHTDGTLHMIGNVQGQTLQANP